MKSILRSYSSKSLNNRKKIERNLSIHSKSLHLKEAVVLKTITVLIRRSPNHNKAKQTPSRSSIHLNTKNCLILPSSTLLLSPGNDFWPREKKHKRG
jgi:hypothetical protein